jgi:endo-1,4-beta-D-glucanase Y
MRAILKEIKHFSLAIVVLILLSIGPVLTAETTSHVAEKTKNLTFSNNMAKIPNLGTDKQIASRFYQDWKKQYLTDKGAPVGLRVQRPEDGGDTVSEGQAYGMLMAVMLNDKGTFDNLWAYTKNYFNDVGLMHWRIGADGSVIGPGPASDADQDMAYALIVADKKWGGYRQEAQTLLKSIIDHEVDLENHIFKPGQWGGKEALNISYLAPGYYRIFADYTGDNNWLKIAEKSYELIEKTAHPETGLVPDWSDDKGNPAGNLKGDPRHEQFFYNAVRTPWRIATDYIWFGEKRAKSIVDKMTNFFSTIGVENLKSGYTLEGKPTASYFDATYASQITAGALISNNQSFYKQLYDKLLTIPQNSYYGDSLRILTLMFVNGQFEKVN